MADEITVTLRFGVTNGNYSPGDIAINNAKFDQAAAGADERIQNIGTSEETLGETLSTEGWLFMRNLDDTNYIQWGVATTDYAGRLEAGEFAIFRAEPGITVYAKANTAACDLWYRWLED